MEFGRVDENDLDAIDFSLAREPKENTSILKGKPAKSPGVYIGCAKWGRSEWVGKIYPPKTRERDFLKHYVEHYNSIELNATHHKIFGALATAKWAEKAKGKDFIFCPKMYKDITHVGKLDKKQFLVSEFMRGINGLGNRLGPVFVQMHERFTPNRIEEMFSFLEKLPKDKTFFLEVRHPKWFEEKVLWDLANRLTEMNFGLVITDAAGRRDAAHMRLTVPAAFIRFVGNSLHRSDYSRIDTWVQRIKSWLDQGLQQLYFFMHMHDEATSPELTIYLVDKMKEVCGIDLPKPRFVDNTILPARIRKRAG